MGDPLAGAGVAAGPAASLTTFRRKLTPAPKEISRKSLGKAKTHLKPLVSSGAMHPHHASGMTSFDGVFPMRKVVRIVAAALAVTTLSLIAAMPLVAGWGTRGGKVTCALSLNPLTLTEQASDLPVEQIVDFSTIY
jgi:hypothetical protein